MYPCPGQAPVQHHLCSRLSPSLHLQPEHRVSMEMTWPAPLWLMALVAGADSSVTVQWWRTLEAQHDWRPVQHWREDTRKLQGGEPGAAESRSFDGAAAVIKE